jgi:hypothetical protein
MIGESFRRPLGGVAGIRAATSMRGRRKDSPGLERENAPLFPLDGRGWLVRNIKEHM